MDALSIVYVREEFAYFVSAFGRSHIINQTRLLRYDSHPVAVVSETYGTDP